MKKILLILLFFGLVSCSGTTFEKLPKESLLSSSEYFVVNPYGNAPLSAELRLAKSVTPLTITVKGQDGIASDLTYTWKDSKRKIYPVLGMYFNTTNTIILSHSNDVKTIKVIITNKPSKYIKKITILTNNRPISPERQNFLNFINPVDKLKDLFAVDNFGKIRWYLTSPNEFHAMKFKEINGEMAFSVLTPITPQILTYNMVGKLLHTIKGPKANKFNVPEANKRFHHDFYYRDNGNILVLDKSQYGVEDTILELTPEGNVINEIQIGSWIRNTINGDPDDYTGLENFIFDSSNNPYDKYGSAERYPGMPTEKNAVDWAHINAISFDEKTDTLYLSFRQHGLFAFDYNNQKLKWIFSRKDYSMPSGNRIFYNLPNTMKYIYQIPALQPYVLKGADGPDFQHAITVLSNNKFMVFDNSGKDGAAPQEGSKLLVFSVDDTNKTATIEWEYKHKNQDNSYVYSQVVSDIDQTPFGTYIGVFGAKEPFTFIEVTTNNRVLFDMRLSLKAQSAGQSDITLPIACPTSRLMQNGIFVYRGDYQAIYPSKFYSLD